MSLRLPNRRVDEVAELRRGRPLPRALLDVAVRQHEPAGHRVQRVDGGVGVLGGLQPVRPVHRGGRRRRRSPRSRRAGCRRRCPGAGRACPTPGSTRRSTGSASSPRRSRASPSATCAGACRSCRASRCRRTRRSRPCRPGRRGRCPISAMRSPMTSTSAPGSTVCASSMVSTVPLRNTSGLAGCQLGGTRHRRPPISSATSLRTCVRITATGNCAEALPVCAAVSRGSPSPQATDAVRRGGHARLLALQSLGTWCAEARYTAAGSTFGFRRRWHGATGHRARLHRGAGPRP